MQKSPLNHVILSSLQKIKDLLVCKLHLKNRYFYTRQNTLRLRYLAMGSLFMCVTAFSILFSSQGSNAVARHDMSLAEISPAAGDNLAPYASDKIIDMMDEGPRAELSLASMLVVPDAPKELPLEREVVIESGDALGVVMEKQGVGGTETNKIITAMKDHLDPRAIKVGQKIAMHFDKASDNLQQFREMKIPLDAVKTLVVARAGEDFDAHIDEKKVVKTLKAKQASIESSLSGSAAKAGIPSAIVAEAIRIYSWNVDFQRDIRADDSLEVLYESYETEDGYVAKNGDVLYAKLTLSGREIPLYRYKMADGRVDYFGPDGRSIKRTLMKTPINGARMSSGFGRRKHPVLGYTKMHKGIDFAASVGTPIFAAGDGTIEKAGWFSSYGKYVRIRHNSQLKTAYAHMSKITSSLKPGSRVRQGDVIGYVGTTGRSTGPHLHYEVLNGGQQVNPRDVNLPTGEELTGSDKTKFKTAVSDLRRQYASALEGTKVADGRSLKELFFN